MNVEIADELKDFNALDQREVDNLLQELDGTDNFKRLGANAVLGVLLANARAAANFLNIPLYQ